MALVVHLPLLIGSREAARALVEQLGAFAQERVVVNCRDTRFASRAVADELMLRLLVEPAHPAAELVFLAAAPAFALDVHQAAATREVAGRVVLVPAGTEVDA